MREAVASAAPIEQVASIGDTTITEVLVVLNQMYADQHATTGRNTARDGNDHVRF